VLVIVEMSRNELGACEDEMWKMGCEDDMSSFKGACHCNRDYMFLHVFTCLYLFVHVFTCFYMFLHVCTCLYMFLHVFKGVYPK